MCSSFVAQVVTTSSVLVLAALLPNACGKVYVNEVASKGTDGVCSGEDWVELFNNDISEVGLDAHILHDDKGPDDENAYTFPTNTKLAAGEFKVICHDKTSEAGFNFKIGGDDTITLLSPSKQLVSTSGKQEDDGSELKTWSRKDNDQYSYTFTPTPGAVNVFTDSAPSTDDDAEALTAQNALGTWFFGMDDTGFKVPGSDAVVELHATMLSSDVDYLDKNQSYEVYSPVQSFKVVTSKGTTTLSYPGRIRPRGQSTLAIGTCLGLKAIPFKIDFGSSNKSQTLFGVSEGYLRNHMSDASYMREWSIHRMLARFGLPYLRTRHVKFYINGVFYGLYSFMEAPDQKYVFERSFPDFDRSTYSLYKFKTLTSMCRSYSLDDLDSARDTDSTSTYSFERGTHRDKIKVLGPYQIGQCLNDFFSMIGREAADVYSAIKRFKQDCGVAMTQVGLLDRDLGGKNAEPAMIEFFNKFLTQESTKCIGETCSNVDLSTHVNVDSWLKNFAVYAVMVVQDSPMGNGNNWFAANPGDGKGIRIVPYDHNNALEAGGADLCANSGCSSRIVDWSVARPTCKGLADNPLVGPLLLKPEFMTKYLDYVEDFVNNVFTSQSLITEMEEHAKALQPLVKLDSWSGLSDYSKELNQDAAIWSDRQTPLLPTMKARAASVTKQLAALKAKTFPRLPRCVSNGESCQDWTSKEAGISSTVIMQKEPTCPSYLVSLCKPAEDCFDHTIGCASDGTFSHPACSAAALCKSCFPNSRCGTWVVGSKQVADPTLPSDCHADTTKGDDGAGVVLAPCLLTSAVLVLTIISTSGL